MPTQSGTHARMERTYTIDGEARDGVAQVSFEAQLYLGDDVDPRPISQRLLALSPDKIRLMMKDEGFREIEVRDGFSGNRYSESSSRTAVIVGRR